MKVELEQELKLLLEAKDFIMLKKMFKLHQESIEQINYYFDTFDYELGSKHITLRIRFEKNQYCICLKHKTSKDRDLISKSKEYNTIITEQTFLTIKDNPQYILNHINNEGLKLLSSLFDRSKQLLMLGSIKNYRELREGPSGLVLTLDHSIFFNAVNSYELEIENINPEEANQLLMMLSKIGIKYVSNQKGKYKRFLALLKDKNSLKGV
ncbi:CYTH domain-containing protein [Fictibacillus nanhaiensis]|uniref:CYTH domain-containing protein n=1 Tax=Fictibacillus nanhaiensis TaxID=742169 RepID=A0ABS2ZP98_9BACL|nr:CYTH domain-containing protein [Fictibacillus nanhaiensis]